MNYDTYNTGKKDGNLPRVDDAVKMAILLDTSAEFLVSGKEFQPDIRPDIIIDKIGSLIKLYKEKKPSLSLEIKDSEPDYNWHTEEIQLNDWMTPAIKTFQTRNNLKSFSETVCLLIENNLNQRGYYRTDYLSGIVEKVILPEEDAKKGNAV